MAGHTPGPWEWWDSCSWRRLTSKDKDGRWMREGNVMCPVVASDGHPDISVSEEDRLLIAAAPDMLAALKAAREPLAKARWLVGTLSMAGQLATNKALPETLDAALADIDDAIAKAEAA